MLFLDANDTVDLMGLSQETEYLLIFKTVSCILGFTLNPSLDG
jgi:hypothetical protein